MKKTYKYSLAAIIIFSLASLIVLAGCEGVSGPRGDKGATGATGPDYQSPVPANRFFSLAVTNGSFATHNGAPKIYLSFDGEHSAAGDTVVSVQLTNGDPRPEIDGVDGGAAEWGNVSSTIALRKAAGDYNYIASADVRSAFDNDYIYFFVKWTEVANSDFGLTVGASADPAFLIYPQGGTGNPNVWDYEEGKEDRLLMLFEITPVTRYQSDGCLVTCHTRSDQVEANYHATRGSGEYMDVWTWAAGLSNPTGFAIDQVMGSSQNRNIVNDNGIPLSISNERFAINSNQEVTLRQPIYQSINDPNANSAYPLWTWQIMNVSTQGWVPGSRVPAYISVPTPSNSAGDVEAKGTFDTDTGTWTVELKRLRRTGNGDDAQF
jgi:hypothetical protein